jgi:hypothetical protein
MRYSHDVFRPVGIKKSCPNSDLPSLLASNSESRHIATISAVRDTPAGSDWYFGAQDVREYCVE